MDAGAADQERETKQLIRRAEDAAAPTHPTRKECLKKLIDAAHSSSASLKKLAADNIPKFYKAFPDLEEDAINSIYDLCEDTELKVRLDGYSAIVHLSKEQRKWVKRNADALVQLLQADEPDEVASVRKALSQHVDLDPKVTFSVLCEQLVPQGSPADEEERTARDHLRLLVLSYMTSDINRIQRHAGKADHEDVLVNGLLKAVLVLSPNERQIIVKDIILNLPSFKPRGPDRPNEELLTRLLVLARPLLTADLRAEKHALSDSTRNLFDLIASVCVEWNPPVSSPMRLLRFVAEVVPSSATAKYDAATQVYLARLLGELWPVCVPLMDSQEQDSNRKYVVECVGHLLAGFHKTRPTDARTWKSVEQLLGLCINRLEQTRYAITASEHAAHQELSRLLDDKQYEEQLQDVDLSTIRAHVKKLCDQYAPRVSGRGGRDKDKRARDSNSFSPAPHPHPDQIHKTNSAAQDSNRARPPSRLRRSPSPRRVSSPQRHPPNPPLRRRSPSPRARSPPPRARSQSPPSSALSIRGQSSRDRDREPPPHLRGPQPPLQPRQMPPPRSAPESNGHKRRERSPEPPQDRSETPPKRQRHDRQQEPERTPNDRGRGLPPHISSRGSAAAPRARDDGWPQNGRTSHASTPKRVPSPQASSAPATAPASAPASPPASSTNSGWSIKGAARREPMPPQSLLARLARPESEELSRRRRHGSKNRSFG